MVYIRSMIRKSLFSLIILVVVLAVSCESGPETSQNRPSSRGGGDGVFDSSSVSQEYYISTRDDVRHFIEELNQIIRNRNYDAWKASLSTEYFEELSSPENLQAMSEQPAMRTRRIVLRTPEDYFLNVVVPSRANLRVDDIEFISRNRVKAFTVTTNSAGEEQRLRLYDLERTGNSWTIIN